MRAVFRELAVRVLLSTLVLCVVVTAGVSWLVREIRSASWPVDNSRVEFWLSAIAVAVVVLLVGAIAVPVVRSLADRAAESVADPLRRLAHRTDEMVSGGFALDPHARPGRILQPEPWQAGVPEIDAVSREIDRHHSTFARTLVSERSFAADASHQLRTPMAALLLRLEEIAQADDVAVARSEADIAISQVERLTGVVDELLRRTRPGHASGGALSSVDAVLTGLDEEWSPAFAERSRDIILSSERGMIVEASASSLSQILNTLVENALVHGAGRVRVHVARSGPSAVFTVSDQGSGIPREMSRSIFDRSVTTGEGTGLGLSVARDTAEASGGRLELTQLRPPVFALYLALAATG